MIEKNGDPLVSVIVAVRNAAGTLEQTLQSICAQTYRRFEIVLIDGASTDGTLDVVNRYSATLAVCLSEPDKGIADAYNKGIRRSTGDWVYFLNADDVFNSTDTLKNLFEGRRYEGYDLVIGRVLADTGRILDGRLSWTLLMRNNVHHQAMFYRGNLIRSHQYNPQYRRYGHDHEHNLWLWRERATAAYVPEVVARWKGGGVSDAATWKDYKEEFKVRRNVIGRQAWLWNGFTLVRFLLKQSRRRLSRASP